MCADETRIIVELSIIEDNVFKRAQTWTKLTTSSFPRRRGSRLIQHHLEGGDNNKNMALPATRNLYDKLDSRLRGNDGYRKVICHELCKDQ